MAEEKKQFLYMLRLVSRLLDEKNWTEREHEIVDQHFQMLQGLLKDGRLILAGRTQNMDPLGLVILEVDSEEEARQIMQNDPAVAKGVMESDLLPYRVALMANR